MISQTFLAFLVGYSVGLVLLMGLAHMINYIQARVNDIEIAEWVEVTSRWNGGAQ